MYDHRILLLCCFVASTAILYPSLFPKTAKHAKAFDPWALETVTSTYKGYHNLAQAEITRMKNAYEKLDPQSKRLGKAVGYPEKLNRLAHAEQVNSEIAQGIASLAIQQRGLNASDISAGQTGSAFRVREALQHYVRDWSEEGEAERRKIFTPIMDVLMGNRGKVLVPGSGLGRLAWDISQLGFDTTANELSHFMNHALKFILDPESTPSPNVHTIQPWAHRFSHQRSDALFRSISFPDTLPRQSSTFRISEGDFLQLAPPTGGYDYIVTLFFIDTSANIASTLLQIYTLLAPGGTWINLGPLLWASGGTVGMELGLEEVMEMIARVGLKVDNNGAQSPRTVECEYTQDPHAMFRRVYSAEFWTATKPE